MMAAPALISPADPIAPMRGVGLAFWGALALLMALGIRYPLKLLPVILLQLTYKLIWLAAVALPAWRAGQLDATMLEFVNGMAIGAVLDVIAIPWGYAFAQFVRAPGDRWWGRAPVTGAE